MNKWVDRGLWNSSSWIIFLRAYQMAHRVTATLAKSSRNSVSIIAKSHYFAEGSSFMHMCSVTPSSARAHIHLVIKQSMNECLHESSCPQIEHALVVAIYL